ncbi:sirohydrochlorin chelatase [Streptomyces sp. NPDC088785]|uniref:sirohydrochlorin chelatase n=1 Tax=Streptomyces sp. NPDC088785 TaxID=3365897 RepID=UPI00380A21B5
MTDESYGTPHPGTTHRDPATAGLDSAAGLLGMISTQLGAQLSNRRPPHHRPRPPAPALVLVAHGSRHPGALATATGLADRIRALRPALTVRLAHIELTAPLLGDALAALPAGRAVLVPLLLSRGHHAGRDLPAAAAAAPHLRTRVADPLGPHPLLVDALHDRLVEAGWPAGPLPARDLRRTAVVLAAAGSRDPLAAVDIRRTAGLLARRLGVPVVPGHASAAAPDVATALRALAARGRPRVAVASYFTAPGRFADGAAAAAAPHRGIAAAPLGTHPALARLVLHRYDSALAAPGTTAAPHLASA